MPSDDVQDQSTAKSTIRGGAEAAWSVVVYWGPLLLFIVILIGLVYVAFNAAARLSGPSIADSIRLPLLSIVGIILLLTALAVVAVAFAKLGLTDKAQALALPAGSVRAAIALCLVVLFAVIAVSLYSSMTEGPIRTIGGLSRLGVVQLTQDSTQLHILAVDTTIVAIDLIRADTSFVVHYWLSPSSASVDFAKQLLVLIGTLVTSVAGFYFGSKATASNPSAGGGGAASPTSTRRTAGQDGT